MPLHTVTPAGGLEELQKEFLESAIMYAFCRVTIPPSGIKKNILINWQGEGAPVVRKGCCANHLPDVERFFKGLQLILNARSDEEIEPEVILEKLEKCFASASIQRVSHGNNVDAPPHAVSSAYQRIQPDKDVVSISEREKFWHQQQEDEKRSAREERKALTERQRREKDEQLQREVEAAKAREQKYRDDSKTASTNVTVKRKPVAPVKKLDISMWEKQIQEMGKRGGAAAVDSEPVQKFDKKCSVRQTRALFENRKDSENSILPDVVPSGNVRTVTGTGTPGKIVVPKFESKPIEKTPIIIDKGPATIVENTSATPQMSQERDLKSSAVGHQPPQQTGTQEFSYTKNLLKEERRESVDTGGNYEEQDWEEEPLEEPPSKIPDPLVDAMLEQGLLKAPPESLTSQNTISADPPYTSKTDSAHPDNPGQSNVPIDKGQCARALFDYEAADDTEISFDPNDIITNIDQIDEGWWQGVAPDGTFGLFPANYVELI
ncbi:drebrin-like protein B isoform X2 [Varroa destructor]|uniref:Drebrin-like protein n=1 Tax=Varroa destructor TaxID=109461 RepID=A0A7M7KL53_VARDE|nr:drebrin-like protein B isoform X2 [Varroa destructor]